MVDLRTSVESKMLECFGMDNHDDKIRADERKKVLNEVEEAMYHQCFVCNNDENMQKWDSGNWFRYKLFENVIEQMKEEAEWNIKDTSTE